MAVSAKAGIGRLRGGGFAALSILLPLAVYFLLLPLVLDGLVPDWLRISSLPLRAAPAEEITGDFSARMDYGLAMAMVIVFSLLVLIEAIWSFAKRRLYRLLGFLVFASLAAGVTTYIRRRACRRADQDLRQCRAALPRPGDQLRCRSVARGDAVCELEFRQALPEPDPGCLR